MLSTIHFAWVKNVNNQRMGRCITGADSSTDSVFFAGQFDQVVVKPLVIQQVILYFAPTISTRNFIKLSLLTGSYTHNPQPLLLEPKKKIQER